MRFLGPAARKHLLKWAILPVVLLGAVAILGALFIWSGAYSVAASRGHWLVAEWLLRTTMRNSVKTHAYSIEVPPFDDDMVKLGAAHFHSGCAYCHGAPGLPPIGPISRAMLPPPPDLAIQVEEWRDRELFWITKNGIKYTGMPGWAAQTRDDEVWSLVAFLRQLPMLDAKAYNALALGGLEIAFPSGIEAARQDATAAIAGACARCHGDEENGPASNLVPVLHGQRPEFLIAALNAYAQGTRDSGVMQPIANERTPEDRANIAIYYARLAPLPPNVTASPESLARGEALAERGDGAIPPCAPCHSPQSLNVYPRLTGQSGRYIANRLRLWKDGLPAGSDGEAIMAPIARLLDDQQIQDAAAYYSSLHQPLPQASTR